MSSEGPDKSARASDGTNALLGDLESIRTLLSEEEDAARAREQPTPVEDTGIEDDAPSPADDEVPLLEDVVSGSLDVDDLALADASDLDQRGGRSGLDEDLFRVLLGDDWRDAAAGILDQARSAIENHQLQWLPEDTDALNDALRERVDETLHRWLREAVLAGMDDLRAQLLDAITDQLEISVRQHLEFHQSGEDPHGK